MPKSFSAKMFRNKLLVSLGPSALSVLRPRHKIVDLHIGVSVALADKPIRRAYFPLSGIISLVQIFGDGTTAGTKCGSDWRDGYWKRGSSSF